MSAIILDIQSKKREVISFLDELTNFLNAEDFDPESDFTLIKKHKKDDEKHSTPYTMVDLEYDTGDVIERVRELTVADYSETKLDKDDLDPPLLFVFGKDIDQKLVYIKLKIKREQRRHVVCVSFHYAKKSMTFPFA